MTGPGGGGRWLVITSSFPRAKRDVAGHFVQKWCEALADRGHQIDVLAWRGDGARDRRFHPRGNVRFVPYATPRFERLFYGAGTLNNLASSPLRALLAVPATAAMVTAANSAVRRERYDGIVGHWLVPGGMIARLVGAMAGLRSAVVGHSGGVHLLDRLPSRFAGSLTRWIAGGPTTVPTVALRERLESISQTVLERVRIAPMGFESVDGDIEPRPGGELTVGFLGRMVPIKGLPTVLRALERVETEGRQLVLEAVGDGPSRGEWESLAGSNAVFFGPKFGDEKNEILKGWDGIVLPSKPTARGRHEGLPVSMLEAASAGAVPLVSGVPGVESWLANPDRQVVEADDVGAWCRALQWFAELDRERRAELRDRSRRVVRPLAWARYGDWWEKWLTGEPPESPSKTA